MSVNINGILKVLKWECITCNYYEELGKKTTCNDCPFCKNSAVKKGFPSRVGLRQKVFLPLGLTLKQCQNWGRHQLFMYLYYPHLNFEPPPLPDFDNYGLPVDKTKARWAIHHINGNHNDNRKDNLTWRLHTDHIRDEQLNNKNKQFIKESAKMCAKELGIEVI